MAKENQIAVEVVTKSDSIAGMREEITSFRKAMNEATIGSEEFEAASSALEKAQDELRNVMKLGTKSVEEAGDSYNTLTRQMAELKEAWRATSDEAKRNELGKQIDGINNRLKDMDASIGNYQRNVGDYRNQMVGAFKDSADAIDHFLPGIGEIGTTIYDVVSASESLSQVLPEVTKGAQGFIGVLKSMKGALIATGIGIFVVALGAVIANWDKISALWNNTTPAERAKAAIDNLNASLERQSSILNERNIQALREYTTALQNAKGDVDAIKAAEDEYSESVLRNRLQIAKSSLAEAWKADAIAYDAYVKKQNDKTLEAHQEAKKRVAELAAEVAQIENEIAKAEANKLAGATATSTPTASVAEDPEEVRLQKMESIGLKEIEIRERVQNKILEGMSNVQEMREKDLDHQRRMAAVEMELENKKAQAKQAAAQVAVQAMQSAATLIGEETAVGKGLMVASALMQTYLSANSAYSAMASIPYVGPALGIAAAAAAAASGLANVKQILSVKTDGSQNNIGGGAMTPAFVSAPAVIQQVPVTRSLTSASEEERLNKMASDTRVYVVESDIRQAGKRTEVREQESSF